MHKVKLISNSMQTANNRVQKSASFMLLLADTMCSGHDLRLCSLSPHCHDSYSLQLVRYLKGNDGNMKIGRWKVQWLWATILFGNTLPFSSPCSSSHWFMSNSRGYAVLWTISTDNDCLLVEDSFRRHDIPHLVWTHCNSYTMRQWDQLYTGHTHDPYSRAQPRSIINSKDSLPSHYSKLNHLIMKANVSIYMQ